MKPKLKKYLIILLLVFAVCFTTVTATYIYYINIPNPKIQLINLGMSKSEVQKLIGEPNWIESNDLWAYKIYSEGIWGWLLPYYIQFDKTGLVVAVFS